MAISFNGLRVATFESRRAGEMGKLIERYGGRAISAPSMREVPLSESPEVVAFGDELLAGRIDMVIFLTGVGARALMALLEKRHSREKIVGALGALTRVVRGPKPVPVLREWGLVPTIAASEPNTTHEVLGVLDASGSLTAKRIAIQEYGEPNEELAEELRVRGADVISVPVYAWALPEDLGPLEGAIRSTIAAQVDVVAFTSAGQLANVLEVTRRLGLEPDFREALRRTVIGSIGPTCSAALRREGLGVDFEPDRTKMGDLVSGLARSAGFMLERKRSSLAAGVDTSRMQRVDAVWSQPRSGAPDPLLSSAFMRACRREKTDYTPIWIMRQAGRFLREYRELRAKVSFLELCRKPELAAEVTLMAVERLGVDAAIIFSDILLIVDPMGVGLSFDAGEGPRIARPVRTREDVDLLHEVVPDSLSFVFDAIRLTRRALPRDIPLIGFCGAPFTVASYMIEGGSSRHFQQTKMLMYRDPGAWHALLERIVRGSIGYLNRQIEAGAQVVQLFDSWVGCLSEADYRQFVLPHARALIAGITHGVPIIYFGTDTTVMLDAMREAGPHVLGLDWRVDLGKIWDAIGHDVAVQGNLDPVVLFATPSEIQRRAQAILEAAGGRPGHIFNLGHGVLPTTPVDHVLALVDIVHEYPARNSE